MGEIFLKSLALARDDGLSQSRSWARPARQTSSEMRCLSVRLTVPMESLSQSVWASTTIVPSDPKKPAAGWRCRCSKELMLGVYRKKLVGPVPQFPAQMEQNINAYLAGGAIANGESLSAPNSTIDNRRRVRCASLMVAKGLKPHPGRL
jgi:hypothetical protein